MSSRHLVDPDLAALADWPKATFDSIPIENIRTMRAAMTPPQPPPSPEVEVCEAHAPGRDGAPDVRLVVTRPKAPGAGRAGILHIHGGGYVLGEADMTGPTDEVYALKLGAVVVSVDYRLAPETPYPGPLEDCYAGLTWLHGEAERLGVDRGRIAVTGESAGGGLAAALVLLARERGEVPVAFQHLVFPMLDDRTVVDADPSAFVGEFIWSRAANRFGWTSLLGAEPGGPDISPFAAPARATDLAGLPPTFMICGALDLFVEENLDYARRLIRAGVPTELHIYPGAPHGFMFVPDAAVTRTYARDSMAAWSKALASRTGI
jgi:triacylglycerol lipase